MDNDPTDEGSPFEHIMGYFPDHPDAVVSDSMAIALVAACETRNPGLVRYALSLSTALACPDEMLADLSLCGAMRLRSLDVDEASIAPWLFRRVTTPGGERLWTFEIQREALAAVYARAAASGMDLGPDALVPAIAEAERSGRSVCTAANDPATEPCDSVSGHDAHDAKATKALVDALQAHWPVDEHPMRRWVGIARLAMCCAELAHFAWGNPCGFQPFDLGDEG